jgi:hypothetical protein
MTLRHIRTLVKLSGMTTASALTFNAERLKDAALDCDLGLQEQDAVSRERDSCIVSRADGSNAETDSQCIWCTQ